MQGSWGESAVTRTCCGRPVSAYLKRAALGCRSEMLYVSRLPALRGIDPSAVELDLLPGRCSRVCAVVCALRLFGRPSCAGFAANMIMYHILFTLV